MIQHRRAQLVQPGERQFHLRLHTRGTRHLAPRCPPGYVFQQRGLADPRLAADHQHPTLPGPDSIDEPVEHAALAASASQLGRVSSQSGAGSHRPALRRVHVAGFGGSLAIRPDRGPDKAMANPDEHLSPLPYTAVPLQDHFQASAKPDQQRSLPARQPQPLLVPSLLRGAGTGNPLLRRTRGCQEGPEMKQEITVMPVCDIDRTEFL